MKCKLLKAINFKSRVNFFKGKVYKAESAYPYFSKNPKTFKIALFHDPDKVLVTLVGRKDVEIM